MESSWASPRGNHLWFASSHNVVSANTTYFKVAGHVPSQLFIVFFKGRWGRVEGVGGEARIQTQILNLNCKITKNRNKSFSFSSPLSCEPPEEATVLCLHLTRFSSSPTNFVFLFPFNYNSPLCCPPRPPACLPVPSSASFCPDFHGPSTGHVQHASVGSLWLYLQNIKRAPFLWCPCCSSCPSWSPPKRSPTFSFFISASCSSAASSLLLGAAAALRQHCCSQVEIYLSGRKKKRKKKGEKQTFFSPFKCKLLKVKPKPAYAVLEQERKAHFWRLIRLQMDKWIPCESSTTLRICRADFTTYISPSLFSVSQQWLPGLLRLVLPPEEKDMMLFAERSKWLPSWMSIMFLRMRLWKAVTKQGETKAAEGHLSGGRALMPRVSVPASPAHALQSSV